MWYLNEWINFIDPPRGKLDWSQVHKKHMPKEAAADIKDMHLIYVIVQEEKKRPVRGQM